MEVIKAVPGKEIFTEAVKVEAPTPLLKYRKIFELDVNNALYVFSQEAKTIEPNYVMSDKEKYVVTNLLLWLEGNDFKSIDPTTKKEIDGDLRKGIYLAGNTGSGKTLITKVLAKISRYDNVSYLFDKIIYSMHYEVKSTRNIVKQFIKSGYTDIDYYCNRSVVCFDDLGADTACQYMGNHIDIITEILLERYDQRNKLFTIITSNYPLASDQIKNRYGDRMQSRLFEMCNYYELVQPDYRKKI